MRYLLALVFLLGCETYPAPATLEGDLANTSAIIYYPIDAASKQLLPLDLSVPEIAGDSLSMDAEGPVFALTPDGSFRSQVIPAGSYAYLSNRYYTGIGTQQECFADNAIVFTLDAGNKYVLPFLRKRSFPFGLDPFGSIPAMQQFPLWVDRQSGEIGDVIEAKPVAFVRLGQKQRFAAPSCALDGSVVILSTDGML